MPTPSRDRALGCSLSFRAQLALEGRLPELLAQGRGFHRAAHRLHGLGERLKAPTFRMQLAAAGRTGTNGASRGVFTALLRPGQTQLSGLALRFHSTANAIICALVNRSFGVASIFP